MEIADFIIYLQREKKLSHSSIAGYISAVVSVRRLHQLSSPLDHPVIRDLLRSVKLEQTRDASRRRLPQWNLVFVLNALTRAPFEPISSASLLHLSWKTAFLLLLASGRRRGEVLSLDFQRIQWVPKKSSRAREVYLFPFPGHLPKILACAEGQQRFAPKTASYVWDQLLQLGSLSTPVPNTHDFRTTRSRSVSISSPAALKSSLIPASLTTTLNSAKGL